MHNYLELNIWKQSRELVKIVYQLSEAMPQSQLYGLTNQMQRAAISIPSNIAEGAGRNSDKDFSRFLSMANGSAFELETQLFLCVDLGYFSKENVKPIILRLKEVQKMIFRFIEKLKRNLDT